MSDEKSVLVTGGAGYIGSHTCLVLLEAGYRVAVIDSLVNSDRSAFERVAELTGQQIRFFKGDVRNTALVKSVLQSERCSAVIHFAGLKAIGESVTEPLAYYSTNVQGTLSIARAMFETGVSRIVFSSTASVYGASNASLLSEDHPVAPTNPYSWSKLMAEQILMDSARAAPDLQVSILRYFNAAGAHPSGRLWESPLGAPNNLFPILAEVALGKRKQLHVFGSDYDTRDGTAERDYVHVSDLADAHIRGLRPSMGPSARVINLGTGSGTTVLEVIEAFAEALGCPLKHVMIGRRPGDVARYVSDPALSHQIMGWKAERSIQASCAHYVRSFLERERAAV